MIRSRGEFQLRMGLTHLRRLTDRGFHRADRYVASLKIRSRVKHRVVVVTQQTNFPTEECFKALFMTVWCPDSRSVESNCGIPRG